MANTGPATTNSVINVLERRVPEVINRALTHYYAGIDPLFKAKASSEKVSREGFGRDYRIRKLYQTGLAGKVRPMSTPYQGIYGSAPSYGPAVARNGVTSGGFYFNTNESAMPGVAYAPNARPVEMIINMQGYEANLDFTIAELDLDSLDSLIGEIQSKKIMGFIENIARTLCNLFYTENAYDKRIAQIYSLEVGAGNDAGRYVIGVGGVVSRFEEGMQVAFWPYNTTDFRVLTPSTAGYRTTAADLQTVNTVVLVDTVAERIHVECRRIDTGALTALDGITAGNGLVGGTGDLILPAGAFSNGASDPVDGINGLEYYIKDGNESVTANQVIHNINVNDFPILKSMKFTESGALTEQKLRKYMSAYKKAKGRYGFRLADVVTTQGVIDAYASTKIGREFIDRTGSALSLQNEGTIGEGIRFTHDGQTVVLRASTYVADGTAYFTDASQWTRYVPPSGNPSGGLANAPGFLEFEAMGRYLGFPSNIIPSIGSTSTAGPDGTTNMEWGNRLQMPGRARMELVPDQIPMLKLSSLTEDKFVATGNTGLLV